MSAGRSTTNETDVDTLPAVGDVVAEKYVIEAVLGSGNMGVVVRARHRVLGQLVAIKFVKPSVLSDEAVLARFTREARALVAMQSDHVVRVLDFGTLATGAPYMVMEHLTGHDLLAEMRQRDVMPIGEAVEYAMQACRGLADIHAHGVVHRDIKPANLFLSRRSDGRVRVTIVDFGISKAPKHSEDELTLTSARWRSAPRTTWRRSSCATRRRSTTGRTSGPSASSSTASSRALRRSGPRASARSSRRSPPTSRRRCARRGRMYPRSSRRSSCGASRRTRRRASRARAISPARSPRSPRSPARRPSCAWWARSRRRRPICPLRRSLPALGKVYSLLGRTDDALPALRASAASCQALDEPFEATRSELLLGDALASRGDNAGACAAYAVVLGRWGHAVPRSVTAETAAEHAKAARCAPR